MLKNIVLASFVFFLNLQTVTAQFGFFENMFGGQHQQQHHQQRTSASQWAAYSDSGMFVLRSQFGHNSQFVSVLLAISLSRNLGLRHSARRLPVSERWGYQVLNSWYGWRSRRCNCRVYQGGNGLRACGKADEERCEFKEEEVIFTRQVSRELSLYPLFSLIWAHMRICRTRQASGHTLTLQNRYQCSELHSVRWTPCSSGQRSFDCIHCVEAEAEGFAFLQNCFRSWNLF